MQRGEHLRHHLRRSRALHQPRDDQFRARPRQSAPQRGDDEAGYTRNEHVPGAVDVAEPAAGDDERRIGDQINRDHGLDLRRAGAQFDGDGRDRDVDNESVDAEHELGGDDDREHPPAPRGIHRVRNDLMHEGAVCPTSVAGGGYQFRVAWRLPPR